MSSCFLKLVNALFLLLLHAAGSILGFNIKCIERERQALLNFKHGLIDPSGMLSTWNNRDCCKWKGIQCNNETGHVEMLHLRGQDTQYLRGVINITSLIDLQNIQHLDLSDNSFSWSHIPELMGSFTELRYLNLSYTAFCESIPCQLGKLTHLQYLDLNNNDHHGELPYQLGNLSLLWYLDLSGNSFSRAFPYQLANLSLLRYLGLSGNSFSEALPYQLANLSLLRYLDLSGNSFSGALPFQVGNFPKLHTLRLAGNFDVKSKDAKWLSNLYS